MKGRFVGYIIESILSHVFMFPKGLKYPVSCIIDIISGPMNVPMMISGVLKVTTNLQSWDFLTIQHLRKRIEIN